ncbi:hypothetical protein AB0M29_22520 [Streptomyces sp. NPDC051976]|uniref:hypothetical protein n=1 Tax=Streptomyces sp. NPDC051976 TaxID=3154947 RepID=UPI003420B429
MAVRAGIRITRLLAASVSVLALGAGCSGGGGGAGVERGIPTPAAGKIAAFDLSALSKDYDLNKTVVPRWSLVATDRAGNVYMMDRSLERPEVMKMTPGGDVSRYAVAVFAKTPTAMVVRSDGSLVFSDSTTSAGAFRVISGNGTETELKISPDYLAARPIGERPDGSLVVSEGGNIWSLKDGKAARLYHQSKDVGDSAVVDPSGTVYVVPANLGDVVVVPVGRQPYHAHESGTVPGTGTPIASMAPTALTPASTGGFYALGADKAITETIVLHVRGDEASVLAKTPLSGRTCAPGKQYPALANSCGARAYIVQSGGRVLLLGNVGTHDGPADPALALIA